jgi:hypothetical protein
VDGGGVGGLVEDEAVGAVVDEAGGAVAVGDEDGKACGHGLEDDVGAGVVEGGVDEEIGGLVDGGHVGLRSEGAHALGEAAAFDFAVVC